MSCACCGPHPPHGKELGIQLVFECTGAFVRREDLERHIGAGARAVILSAPSKDGDVETVVHGVNIQTGSSRIVSCASCTTNCITPVVADDARRRRARCLAGPLVSSDIVGDTRASIVDLELTKVVDGDLVKIMAWHDDEWGYADPMFREGLAMTRSFTATR